MVIDPGGGTVQQIPVGRSIRLKLDDIVDLHGYQISRLENRRGNSLLNHAITEVHLALGGMGQWRKWLESWANGVKLPDLGEFPLLRPAVDAFDAVCGGSANESGVAKRLVFHRLNQCGKYFVGERLENYVFDAARCRWASSARRPAAGIVIKAPSRPGFELDVAAIIGYQLFAISCRD
ncbi:MAG: hypothetical protein IPO15_10490 [Anaerolineae bacterium]|uniref:hypothetical protein n=1 Tax=Candidatus Amarolinea dominans TaxID=3140696 RepID=UPI00313611E2|nr:hypothetical protein [Anaerolineae bacterium]